MAKPILFIDFDGTLCHDRYWRSLASDQYQGVQALVFGEDKTLAHEWMLGKRSAEEINHTVAEHLGIPFEKLWGVFVHDCETMRVPLDTLKSIGSLQNRYTTILVTVNMDSFSRFTVPALNLTDFFDAISNSCETRKFKETNNGEIFKELATEHESSLADCIVIDDSPTVCEVFRNLGGTAYQVTAEHDLPYHLKAC